MKYYNILEDVPVIYIYDNENENKINKYIFNENTILTKTSGLKYKIWINNDGNNANYRHNLPRLKIEVDGKFYPIIFYPKIIPATNFPSKVNRCITSCEKFIKVNQILLMDYWNGRISWSECISQIKKV